MLKRSPHVNALLRALRFHAARPELLRGLDDSGWERLLRFSDRAHLTLILGRVCPEYLPRWVQERIDRNLADNTERVERIQKAYCEVAEALDKAGVKHLVLKGFSQWPGFVSELRLRMQSDLDIYCPGSSIFPARDALLEIGYEHARSPERNLTDHLPPLIRKTGWQWRGNSFDPQMPPSVELHFRLWNAVQTRMGATDFGAFWNRRIKRQVNSICFTSLHPIDSFDYSALHAFRHLLLGGLIPSHIYELGFFINNSAENEPLWNTWRDRHDESLRPMTAVASLLAVEWFGCRLPHALAEEIARLPDAVPRWMSKLGESPLRGLFQPNKDALWLHLPLIGSAKDRRSVLLQRLFPLWVPSLDSRWVQEKDGDDAALGRWLIGKYATYAAWFIIRVWRHLRALPIVLWQGVRMRMS